MIYDRVSAVVTYWDGSCWSLLFGDVDVAIHVYRSVGVDVDLSGSLAVQVESHTISEDPEV